MNDVYKYMRIELRKYATYKPSPVKSVFEQGQDEVDVIVPKSFHDATPSGEALLVGSGAYGAAHKLTKNWRPGRIRNVVRAGSGLYAGYKTQKLKNKLERR
jgi:hypothetical protein